MHVLKNGVRQCKQARLLEYNCQNFISLGKLLILQKVIHRPCGIRLAKLRFYENINHATAASKNLNLAWARFNP